MLGASSPPSASIVSVVATIAKEGDGGMMVSSYNHHHYLNLRSNSHHANTRTSTTTADVLSKGHNLRRLQVGPNLVLIDTAPTSPLRQLQGGLTCDANSNNAGTVCTKDQDCPVSN